MPSLYGVDEHGKPVGEDQQTPFVQTEHACPASQEWNETEGKCKNLPTAQGPNDPRYTTYKDWYKDAIGREPSAQEIESHFGNPGGDEAVKKLIYDSPEAKAYAASKATIAKPTLTAPEFIKQWQLSNPASAGIGPLTAALKSAGYTNVNPFMYGATASKNELSIDGQKFKVLSGEDTANPSWYTGGNDSGNATGNFTPTAITGPTAAPPPNYVQTGPAPAPFSQTAPPPAPFVQTAAPTTPIPTYTAPAVNTPAPVQYTPMQFLRDVQYQGPEVPTYQGYQFSPLAPFQSIPQKQQTSDLLTKMLSEGSLSDSVVAQMKEGQKSGILDRADQLKQQLLQGAASRGVVGGGETGLGLANLGQASLSDISKSYRDIDIQRALTQRGEQERAVGLSNQLQQQALSEYLGMNQLGLSREQSQAGEGYKVYQSQADKEKEAFARFLGIEDIGLRREQAQAGENQFLANLTGSNAGRNLQAQGLLQDVAFREFGSRQAASTDEFQRWLGTQTLGQTGAQNNFQNWLGTQNLGQTTAANNFNRWLGTEQVGQTNAQNAFTNWLQSQGLNLDYQTLREGARRFDLPYQLDVARFLSGG